MSTMAVNRSTAALSHRCRKRCPLTPIDFYIIVIIDIILNHGGEKVPIYSL
jgi:hypothetical protein